MTNAQIKYITEVLGYSDEVANNRMGYAPLFNNKMFIISKDENMYSDVGRWRYKFNHAKNVVERCFVKFYSFDVNNVPAHGQYDYYKLENLMDKYGNPVYIVYEYVLDKDGNKITDYYNYDAVLMFITKPSVNPTEFFL